MRILLSGASGFIGKPLGCLLLRNSHTVIRLVRKPTADPTTEILWNPEKELLIPEQLEGFDAVIHLAGENISSGRWTADKRRKIFSSRVDSTRFLSQTLSQLDCPPRTFISPSAVGYYGDRGEEKLFDESAPGSGFLAEVCCEWEQAAQAIAEKGARVVHPRFGMVIGKGGGALQKMLWSYRLGLGGRLGSGKQWVSWVSLDDLLYAILFLLENESLNGPFNLVSFEPVRQEIFAKKLAAHLHRPAYFSQPAWLLSLLLGQMADELLLASQRAFPSKLTEAGFVFRHFLLDSALTLALK